MSSPDWDGMDVPALLHDAAELAATVLRDASTGTVTSPMPIETLNALRTAPLPSGPQAVGDVIASVRELIAPYPMGNGHPRFMAWVNSPPHPVGVAAAMIAAALNPSVAGGRHSAVHVEHAVIRWLLGLAGWTPDDGSHPHGLFVSGGSAATTTALAAARHRAYRQVGWDVRARGVVAGPVPVIFATSEAHSCATKAVELLGLGNSCITRIATDSERRMVPHDLHRAIVRALDHGQLPVAVVASAGTVNTGAIDPLAEIGRICRQSGVWLHVDGAYGAPAVLLLDEFTDVRAGLVGVDSIALDPHKWLYAPVDAGVVLFRDGDTARSAFSLVPSYLTAEHADDEPPWFAEYGSEQTRPFRALKVWMQLQHLGVDGYRDLITRDLAIAATLRNAVDAAKDFEMLAHGLSVVCFRHRPDGVVGAELDLHNRALVERLQRDGRGFLAPTVIDGVTALRACIVDPRTTPNDVTAVIDALRDLTTSG